MTDVLAERFTALADRNDDSNWVDVRRRVRHRRRRVAVPVAAVLAAVVTAGAIAATDGWLFSGANGQLVGVTHVTLDGKDWRVTLSEDTHGGISFFSVGATNGTTRSHGGSVDMTSIRWFGPRFVATSAIVPGGSIWAGTTLASTVRVSITDYAGRVYTTNTIAAPQATKTPYRYWAIAVSEAPAETLTTYDAAGTSTRWRLGMSAPS